MNMHIKSLSLFVVIVLSVSFIQCKSDNDSKSTTETAEASIVQPIKKSDAHSAESPLKWHSMDNIASVVAKDKKKILVDVYTDWCGWCKVMDNKTFTDPQVIDYLTKNFHLVKFNAEQKEPINFNGKSYEWVNSGRKGVNTLAVELLNGRLGYPSLVYLDENLKTIQVSPGYKKPEQLLAELANLRM